MPATRQLFLKKHADYQRAYAVARKGRTPLMGWFAAPREGDVPAGAGMRIGLTVPVALGKAVDRNRIKRRMRAAVRLLPADLLAVPMDIILHPRRAVLDCEFAKLQAEIEKVLRDAIRAVRKA